MEELHAHREKSKIITSDYQSLVNDFNANDDISFLGNRLDQLFENIVEQYPSNIALIHNGNEISYRALNASANILARSLAERGLKHGDVVGLAVSRSIDLTAAMLAVLKLGAAYVPIDPSFPGQRINHMVEDAGLKFILLSEEPTEGLANWKELCIKVSETRNTSIIDTTNLATKIVHQELAYIIYTSGSTGKPKGVEISHGAAANFLTSLRKFEPGCSEHDRLLAITTISFDMSVLELYLPIVSGATMVIANAGAVKDPREILGLMNAHQITILQATPASWTMLLDSGWNGKPRLSKILCGGEPLSRQLANRLLASADSVWNVYGPAETTYGSVGRIDAGDITVGNPVVNGRIYVLNEDLLPMPIGCEGEVYIGGGSVSNGYRNKPELTHSRFLNNPFHGGLFFRTGDQARFIAPGKLQVIGRIDGVVKIRGYRIDIGDIESVLLDNPHVAAAAVIERDERLVAYYVPHMTSSYDLAAPETVLRLWVAERLPAYMLPAFFVPMDALPLSPSEKVNRKALPNPLDVLRTNHISIKPFSKLGQQVHNIWSAILGHDQFGIEDNFFNIGGDSVRIIRMQAALEKLLHRAVPIPKLFEHFTIKALAAYLSGSENANDHQQQRRIRCRGADSNRQDDIAIISMACRLPGGVATPEDFWKLLESGGDAMTDIPKDRWDAQKLFNADPDVKGTSYCTRGGFLESINSYDTSFFGISPREARAMDYDQHLMLELCWESFERGGYTKQHLHGSATGVFLGVSKNRATNNAGLTDLEGHSITGSAEATLSGRLSYTFNLHGPSLTVDTACSSSLVALHLACNALRQGECNMALVGGVSLLLNPGIHIEFSKLRGLSADGRCRAFSDDADGTGFSEGAAIVILKPLSDAQRDGDDIHAVIRGSAVMHGGHSVSLPAPNGPGQEALIQTTLACAALEPGSIDYIEAHGTATKLGDPIEVNALAGVFAAGRPLDRRLLLGSAKSNVGHTQAAAGLVGLLKVVLSMQNNTIPKTLHVREPTRAIDWKSANLELVLQSASWLPNQSRPRIAGVSAFGIGGTNAHVIIQESPQYATVNRRSGHERHADVPTAAPFILSSRNDIGLRGQAEKLRLHLESGDGKDHRLADVAYSLATSRTHFHRRLAFAANDRQQVITQLKSISSGHIAVSDPEVGEANLAMLFTGQGNHRTGMGKDLYALFPVFRDTLDEIAAQFDKQGLPLLQIMWTEQGNSSASLLSRTDLEQPVLFALQVSLWRLWENWGIKADILLGHSVGELAVAHVAGILDLHDACYLVLMRGRLMQAVPCLGKMSAIETSCENVALTISKMNLSENVQIASYNTLFQTVISGDARAVEALEAHFASLGLKHKTLDTSHAFHSHHMDQMLDDFQAVVETMKFKPATIPVISTMTGRLARDGELQQVGYWIKQIRNAVRFRDAFQSLLNEGANIFLEIGPSPTLCGMGAACLDEDSQAHNALWLPSLKPNMDESSVIQDSVSKLHVRNVSVNWSAFFQPFGCCRVALPTYAFQREAFQGAPRDNCINGSLQADGTQPLPQKLEDMMFRVDWRRIEPPNSELQGSWGLHCPWGETAWTKEIQKVWTSSGMRLVILNTLQEAGRLGGIVSLWDSPADVVSAAHACMTKGLAQLQDVVRSGCSVPVVWVTRHAISVGEADKPVRIGAAPLLGLMRAARSEQPELQLRLIDIDDSTPLVTLRSALIKGSTEIAVRRSQLLEPHLVQDAVTAMPKNQLSRRINGAVLVTGGLGDIGSRIARRLASAHGVNDLVLLSRQGMQTRGAEKVIADLAELGARATVIAIDVADTASMISVMHMFTPERPLRGVVHAAGVVDSATLLSLTPEKCVSTFTPKVNGLWNLHQLTKDMELDFFVMLSSISGVVGMPGLANYAAANSFTDMLAHLRRAQGLPAVSLAYGTWDGEGMITTLTSSTRSHLSEMGMGLIAPKVGLDLFERAVIQGHALSILAVLDLARLKTYYVNQGGVPPLLRTILNAKDNAKPITKTATLCDMLTEAVPQERAGIVLRMVQETVAKALELSNPEDLDASRPLKDFGIDSLTAVLMRNRLTMLTGITLPPNITLLHPNLKSLSAYLHTQLTNTSRNEGAKATIDLSVDMEAVRRGVLDPNIQFCNAAQNTFASPRQTDAVLVTGATGFVGAFMVHELLRRRINVHCLVRGKTISRAQERMVHTLHRYSLWEPSHEPMLHSIPGDLSQPFLGLGEADFNELANKIGCIFHSGALVDWLRPLEDYVGPNVLGTHEVLRLASRGRAKAVHFISTISTLPIHLGYGLTENDREYGYGTSKYLAERMVVAARFRGANTTTYRLPFVTASTISGHFRDRGDFLNNLITGSLDMGAFPSIDANMSSVLPVDYLCNTIATVMTEDQERIGKDYDFVNPRAPTFKHFFQDMSAASGVEADIPFDEWHRRALEYTSTHPKSCLARITSILDGYSDKTAGDLVRGSSVGKHILGADIYPAPLLDTTYVHNYLRCILGAEAAT
ncbi:polyketide synthase [Tothia fuscella]|uniref:Polyketide synthase n=1 Tax=Tothia fuscella TaxID=1048955 RepID=A0A9P4NT65_9PEZI|nr:polyketide synthase [Tothia fuscella]